MLTLKGQTWIVSGSNQLEFRQTGVTVLYGVVLFSKISPDVASNRVLSKLRKNAIPIKNLAANLLFSYHTVELRSFLAGCSGI